MNIFIVTLSFVTSAVYNSYGRMCDTGARKQVSTDRGAYMKLFNRRGHQNSKTVYITFSQTQHSHTYIWLIMSLKINTWVQKFVLIVKKEKEGLTFSKSIIRLDVYK